jgi:hypothetical protein
MYWYLNLAPWGLRRASRGTEGRSRPSWRVRGRTIIRHLACGVRSTSCVWGERASFVVATCHLADCAKYLGVCATIRLWRRPHSVRTVLVSFISCDESPYSKVYRQVQIDLESAKVLLRLLLCSKLISECSANSVNVARAFVPTHRLNF